MLHFAFSNVYIHEHGIIASVEEEWVASLRDFGALDHRQEFVASSPVARIWASDLVGVPVGKHMNVRKWKRKLVQCFFRDLTDKRLRRGVFRSVGKLIASIEDYLECYNSDPKPFVWTAKATDILEKVKRARAKLHTLSSV